MAESSSSSSHLNTDNMTSTTVRSPSPSSAFLNPADDKPPSDTSDTPRAPSPSSVSKTVRSATQLFLTRRLAEAYQLLLPILPEAVHGSRSCTKTLRVKIWNLYLAILDAAAKMNPEEGKAVWGGNQAWKEITKKVKGGKVWNQVWQGYGGEVDEEVVTALVMLEVAHATNHKATQQKVEDYLSAGPSHSHDSSEDSQQRLINRSNLVELYVLHVLPLNSEWDYAREFTRFNHDLSDEQKQALLQSLDDLETQKKSEAEAAKAETAKQLAQLEADRLLNQQLNPPPRAITPPLRSPLPPSPLSQQPVISANTPSPIPTPTPSNAAPPQHRAITKRPRQTYAQNVFGRVQGLLGGIVRVLQGLHQRNRASLARTVLILVALVWMGSKREVRDRTRRMLGVVGRKVATTVGMGVKVSYI
ncbi:hypothetical protein BJ508DRAFT_360546 [Ascobolus immersus RN42]|uniref:Peroxin 26 n=1 Tax=Ascobolus immersus RN42 TaxID=1160509 RepID=A0A3N4IB68_ASCIM|nr:hypothetical protein BJ508DRAFT_360546 [Ascobolus immersus RN42]